MICHGRAVDIGRSLHRQSRYEHPLSQPFAAASVGWLHSGYIPEACSDYAICLWFLVSVCIMRSRCFVVQRCLEGHSSPNSHTCNVICIMIKNTSTDMFPQLLHERFQNFYRLPCFNQWEFDHLTAVFSTVASLRFSTRNRCHEIKGLHSVDNVLSKFSVWDNARVSNSCTCVWHTVQSSSFSVQYACQFPDFWPPLRCNC